MIAHAAVVDRAEMPGAGAPYSAALIGISLDTTAVLLTTVLLTLTRRLGLRPPPSALLAVWLANTASLLLPVSNLTNLLAAQRERTSPPRCSSRGWRCWNWWPSVPERMAPADRWTFRVCALACVALAPGYWPAAPRGRSRCRARAQPRPCRRSVAGLR